MSMSVPTISISRPKLKLRRKKRARISKIDRRLKQERFDNIELDEMENRERQETDNVARCLDATKSVVAIAASITGLGITIATFVIGLVNQLND